MDFEVIEKTKWAEQAQTNTTIPVICPVKENVYCNENEGKR